MAKKYFGDGLAIGKRLQIKGSNIDPLEVSAVFKEREKN